jgi:peptide/nickel transport system substrate-binding protein
MLTSTWVRDTPRGRRFVGRCGVKAQALALVMITLAVLLAACGDDDDGGGQQAAGKPVRGGEVTALLGVGYAGTWPAGLDPATNTNGAANQHMMTSIFGQLFQLSTDGKVVPTLARGWDYAPDAKSVRIFLRKGVEFSDGAPFDAETVAWHFKRMLESDCVCAPPWGPLVESVTSEGDDTVEISFKVPYGAAINSFIVSNVNWVASRRSLERMGERAFRLKPVGAGPFKVVSNKLSNELVLERNPTYFEKGKPYLDRLTFKTTGDDQSALQAIQAGQAQVYDNLSTPTLIDQVSEDSNLQVTQHLSTSPYVLQLNTAIPPFDDKKAREAIYYATDTEAIRTNLFKNKYEITQSFTGPGGLFHHQNVPGYRTYDLERAKQLVRELGGLKVTLGTIKVLVAEQTTRALQTQWEEAGMDVTIRSYDLPGLIQAFESQKWNAMLQTAGSWDPAGGVGVAFRYISTAPFSGTHDKKLDALLNAAAATTDLDERDQRYQAAAKYISDQAYSPFLFAFAPASVVTNNVQAPGLTEPIPAVVVIPTVPWEEVSATSDE